MIGDESWDLDYHLHENPDLKKTPFVWMTDFVGYLPMPNGAIAKRLAADYNAEMITQHRSDSRVRDKAIFVGNPDDIVPAGSVQDLPTSASWTEAHYDFAGYVTGFDPAALGDRDLKTFDLDMSLRIATELYLKRVLVGGIERVYELGRSFRNEGIDSTHSPEYTHLEAYEAYGDYDTMAELTRALIVDAAIAAGQPVAIALDGTEIDLMGDWRSVTLHDAVSAAIGEQITVATDTPQLRQYAKASGVPVPETANAGEIVLELYEKLVEQTLMEPTFVRDYPVEVRPLARPHRRDPRLAEAWDLVIGGIEIAPAYSELVDPVEQRRRLMAQAAAASRGDPEAMQVDEDFLRALEYGMPPAGGMGMGVDRLVVLLTGRGIRETILFPLLKPL